jgi:hypothetical protein
MKEKDFYNIDDIIRIDAVNTMKKSIKKLGQSYCLKIINKLENSKYKEKLKYYCMLAIKELENEN